MVDARSVARSVRGPALIVVAVVLGLGVPTPDALAVATTPLVAFLVFGALHGRTVETLRGGGRPRFAAVALGVVYLLPVAFAPVPALLLDDAALAGVLLATAAPPTAGSAIVWTRHGGGDAVATVLVAMAAVALAPLGTPAVLTAVFGHGVAVDPLPLVRELLLVVGGGVALTLFVPEGAVDETTLDRLSLAAVGALLYVGTATTAMGSVSPTTLAVVGGLAVGFLACAGVVATVAVPLVGRPRATALFFSVGLRNLGIAVAVATLLPVEGAVVVVVTFYVSQQLVAAVAAEHIGHRSPARSDRSRPVDS